MGNNNEFLNNEQEVERNDAVTEQICALQDNPEPEVKGIPDAESVLRECFSTVKDDKKPMPTALNMILSVAAAVLIVFLGSMIVDKVSALILSKNIQGVWCGNGNESVSIIVENDEFTVAIDESEKVLEYKYKVVSGDKIQLTADSEEDAKAVSEVLPEGNIYVEYDRKNDTLIFTPDINGQTKWKKASGKTEKDIMDRTGNYEKFSLGDTAENFAMGDSLVKMLEKEIEGGWIYDIGAEYGSGSSYVYILMEDGRFTLANEDGMIYLECDYEVVGKDQVKFVEGKDASISNFIPQEVAKVKIEKEKADGKTVKTIIFEQGIGGITTWEQATKEEVSIVKKAIEKADEPEMPEETEEIPEENVMENEEVVPEEGAEEVVETVEVPEDEVVTEPVEGAVELVEDEYGNLVDPNTGEIIVSVEEMQ